MNEAHPRPHLSDQNASCRSWISRCSSSAPGTVRLWAKARCSAARATPSSWATAANIPTTTHRSGTSTRLASRLASRNSPFNRALRVAGLQPMQTHGSSSSALSNSACMPEAFPRSPSHSASPSRLSASKGSTASRLRKSRRATPRSPYSNASQHCWEDGGGGGGSVT